MHQTNFVRFEGFLRTFAMIPKTFKCDLLQTCEEKGQKEPMTSNISHNRCLRNLLLIPVPSFSSQFGTFLCFLLNLRHVLPLANALPCKRESNKT